MSYILSWQQKSTQNTRRPTVSKYTSLFSQILKLFPRDEFNKHVHERKAERHARGVTCWQQFTAMLFGQFASARSLSEVTNGLKSCEGKLQHLGIEPIPKSSLAYVNSHRPSQLYQDVFYDLLHKAQSEAGTWKKPFGLKKKLYSIDSTTIGLCLSMYDWAKFRRKKGGLKIHLRLDHDGYLPEYAVITEAKIHDYKMVDKFPIEPDTITTFDRGYNAYVYWSEMCEHGASFVTRLKDNAVYEVIEEMEIKGKNILRDARIRLTGISAAQKCPHELRIVEYYDEEEGRAFVFVTNNLKLAASTIAQIYKERWKIELFFKAIKQNLKIKTFLGTSQTAVETQIWTALIAILVLKYLQLKSKIGWALSNLVALLRMNLFTYRDLWAWIDKPYGTPPEPLDSFQCEQLELQF